MLHEHRVRSATRWSSSETAFKFNDAVLRHLTVQKDGAEAAPSPMMAGEKAKNLNTADAAEAATAAQRTGANTMAFRQT